jgi:hypothetical protein
LAQNFGSWRVRTLSGGGSKNIPSNIILSGLREAHIWVGSFPVCIDCSIVDSGHGAELNKRTLHIALQTCIQVFHP